MTLIVLICFAHWTAFDLSVPGNTSPLFPRASHLGKQIRKPEYSLLRYQWESKAGKPLPSNGGNSGTSAFPYPGYNPKLLIALVVSGHLKFLALRRYFRYVNNKPFIHPLHACEVAGLCISTTLGVSSISLWKWP